MSVTLSLELYVILYPMVTVVKQISGQKVRQTFVALDEGL